MAFQPATKIIEVRMQFLQLTSFAENIYHVRSEGVVGSGMLEDLAAEFYNWWNSDVKAFVSEDVTLQSIKLRDLTSEFAAFYERSAGLPLDGTLASPVLPFNVTPCVSWGTGLTGRSARGRTYHVGLSEVQALGGLLTDSAHDALLGAYAGLVDRIIDMGQDLNLCVLQRVEDGVPLADAIGRDIITTAIDLALDSQRRRLIGRGM
jgi:hypothetical protein